MNVAVRTVSLALATLVLPASAFASSDAEWAKFAKDVETKCTEATAETFRKPQIAVDPTGSENYGLAIVYGRSKQAKSPAAVICVYDKKTQKVEIGGELGNELIRVRKPKAEGAQSTTNSSGSAGSADDDTDQE